jgi:membrane associated rhomboid family serine protease
MFFILPVGVDYRARRYPVVTFTLMGLCVAVYLVTLILQAIHGSDVEDWVFGYLWLIPSKSYWWTYITSMFVHAGFFHLAGNMVYLFLFGSCVEDVIGRPRFISFYFLSGLVSELMHIAISPGHFGSDNPLGGASGAISGCIGGFLVLFVKTRIEFKWVIIFMLRVWNGEFFLPAWVVISFWFLIDFGMMLLTMSAARGSGTAFGAHVGGTVCGIGLIWVEKLFPRAFPADEETEETPAPIARRAPVRVQLRPISVAPGETASIYLFCSQSETGPFTTSEIQQMFINGAMLAETFYWQAGMPEWRNAEELRPPEIG